MNVIVDFCLIPIGIGVSLSPYVAACERILHDAGLKTELHANGTNIEGDWDAVFAAIKRCHQAVHGMGTPRITTVIKLGTRTDRPQTMKSKVESVLRKIEGAFPLLLEADPSPTKASPKGEPIAPESELDATWPTAQLLDAIRFQPRVRGRVEQYFTNHGMISITPRQLMDLFLPRPPFHTLDRYDEVPMHTHPQFGFYLYESALLSLCEANLGEPFVKEWAARIYCMTVAEMRESPANAVRREIERRRQRKAK